MRLPPIILSLLLCTLALGQGAAGKQEPHLPYVILSPMPDSSLGAGQPLEVSLLLDGTTGLDLRLLLDSLDITAQAQLTNDYLFYLSPSPPSPGRHTLSVILLSQSDTVFVHHWIFLVPSPEVDQLTGLPPLEFSVDGGLYFSSCNRDTAGLGLVSPVGWHALGSAHLSARLWSGMVFSHLSFDPAYDRSIHGTAQYQRDAWELSLGEFYPDLCPLAFAGPSPLGLMAICRSGIIRIQGAAGRTQKADTTFQTYEQYLYGGQLDITTWHRTSLSSGFLYGWDRPGSLPDSVRFPTSTFIYDDTLTGLVDTMTMVDTLPSGSNSLWWLSAEYAPGKWRWRAAVAQSGFRPDLGGNYFNDRSFLLGFYRQVSRHSLDISYLSWGEHYRSFGNPYQEAAKNELLWNLSSRWATVLIQADGSLYRVFTDSSGGNSLRAGSTIKLAPTGQTSINIRADYQYRPYRWYLFTSRSFSLEMAGRAGQYAWQTSLGLSSNNGIASSQSYNARLALSRRIMKDRLLVEATAAYLGTDWNSGLSSQDQITAGLTSSVQASERTTIRLELRQLSKWGQIDPLKDYRQRTAVLSFNHRL